MQLIKTTQGKRLEMEFVNYVDQLSSLMLSMQASCQNQQTISQEEGIRKAVDEILRVKERKGLVGVIGNGGSASIAAHICCDLHNSGNIKAMTFDQTATLTALSNDFGYENALERQVSEWLSPNDLLIAVSSSGESSNILRATRCMRDRGCSIITMTGFSRSNLLRAMGNINFHLDIPMYGLVEVGHMVLAHYLCDAVNGNLNLG